MNKFDFSPLPEKFHFYYVDSQGHQWIAQKRPIKTPMGWMPIPVSQHDTGYQPIGEQISPDFWEESLQQRPVTVEWLQSIGFDVDGTYCRFEVSRGTFLVIVCPGEAIESVNLKDYSDNEMIIVSLFSRNGHITREKVLYLLAAFGHEQQ